MSSYEITSVIMKTRLSPQPAMPGDGRRAKRAVRNKHSRSLVESVVDSVTQQITSCKRAPGEKLPTELQMMQTLGVSRTVIREAISRLQAAGLVETLHGVGTFVLEPRERTSEPLMDPSLMTMYDVLDMLEFRICLETQAAGLAAVKRTEEDVAAIKGILQAFVEQVRAGANAVEADLDFHSRIGKSTGNRYFEEFYRFIGQNTIPRMRLKVTQYTKESEEVYLMRIHAEHLAVHDAITRQDPESAQAAMRMHLVNSRERLRKALELDP